MNGGKAGANHVIIPNLRAFGLICRDTFSSPLMAPEGSSSTHWMLQTVADLNALGGSYTVFLFLGRVPDDSSEWNESPSSIGQHHAFTGRGEKQERLTQSTVYIDDDLTRRHYNLSDAESVIAHVRKDLRWRIQKVGTFASTHLSLF
jgi:hypothetical protein